jgi:hypothetical protein
LSLSSPLAVVVPSHRCCRLSSLSLSLSWLSPSPAVVPGSCPPAGRWSSRWLLSSASCLVGVVVVVVTPPPSFSGPVPGLPGRGWRSPCRVRPWPLLLLLPSLLVSLPLFLAALVSFLSFPRFSSSLASSGAGSGVWGCCGGGGGGLVVVIFVVVAAAAVVVVVPWRRRRPRLVVP